MSATEGSAKRARPADEVTSNNQESSSWDNSQQELEKLERTVLQDKAALSSGVRGHVFSIDAYLNEIEKSVLELDVNHVHLGRYTASCHYVKLKQEYLEIVNFNKPGVTPAVLYIIGVPYTAVRSITLSTTDMDVLVDIGASHARQISSVINVPTSVWPINDNGAWIKLITATINKPQVLELREFLIENFVSKFNKDLKFVKNLPIEAELRETARNDRPIRTYSQVTKAIKPTASAVKEPPPPSPIPTNSCIDLDEESEQIVMREIHFITNLVMLGKFRAKCISFKIGRASVQFKQLANDERVFDIEVPMKEITAMILADKSDLNGSRHLFLDVGAGCADIIANALQFPANLFEFNENGARMKLLLNLRNTGLLEKFDVFLRITYANCSGRDLTIAKSQIMEAELTKATKFYETFLATATANAESIKSC